MNATRFVLFGILLGIVIYRLLLRCFGFSQEYLSIQNYSIDVFFGIIVFGLFIPTLKSVFRLSLSQLFFLAGLIGLGIGLVIVYIIFP